MKATPTLFSLTAVLALTLTACGTDADEAENSTSPATAEASATNSDATSEAEASDDEKAPETQETAEALDESEDELITGNFTTEATESKGFPGNHLSSGQYPVEVRGGIHDDYDRIVIEHAGTGTPAWHAEYFEGDFEDMAGEKVGLSGKYYLQLDMVGMATMDELANQDLPIEDGYHVTETGTDTINDVVAYLPFENTSTYVIGLDEKLPYRIKTFEDPARVVIDFKND